MYNLHHAIDDLTDFVRFLFDTNKGPHIGCGFIYFYGCKFLYISHGITPKVSKKLRTCPIAQKLGTPISN